MGRPTEGPPQACPGCLQCPQFAQLCVGCHQHAGGLPGTLAQSQRRPWPVARRARTGAARCRARKAVPPGKTGANAGFRWSDARRQRTHGHGVEREPARSTLVHMHRDGGVGRGKSGGATTRPTARPRPRPTPRRTHRCPRRSAGRCFSIRVPCGATASMLAIIALGTWSRPT